MRTRRGLGIRQSVEDLQNRVLVRTLHFDGVRGELGVELTRAEEARAEEFGVWLPLWPYPRNHFSASRSVDPKKTHHLSKSRVSFKHVYH